MALNRRNNTAKDSIFEHIPAPTNPDKLTLLIFNGHGDQSKMKDYRKSHMHSKGFEPVSMSSFSQGTAVGSNFGKSQHFQFGEVACGDRNNNMIYGSMGVDSGSANRSKQNTTSVKRFYEAPDHFRYGEKDFSYTNRATGKTRISNVFSLEERTSAEIRKKQREAQETENDYNRYVKEKEQNRKRIDNEKRKDHQMLTSYKPPWGKAGGGAPNERHERTTNINQLIDHKEQTLPFGRPGCGAPLKTNSGNLRAGLPADAEIRFQKRDRNQIYDVIVPEGKMKNRQGPFNPFETDLDILAHDTREKRKVLKRNQDLSASVYDPFGRPGAGAPLRDDQGQALAVRSKVLIRTVEGNNDGDNRMIDTSLKYGTPRLRKSNQNFQQNGFYGGFGRGGGGAPIVGDDGFVKTSKRQTFVKGEDGAVIKTDSNESLDHRGGGGAPVRDTEGNLLATYQKWNEDEIKTSYDAETKRKYLENLRSQVEEQESLKRAEKSEMIKPSTDTMSWIKKGKVGRPPVNESTHEMLGAPRMTSDVVRQRLDMNQMDKSKFREYHDELDKHSKLQVEIKQQELQEQRDQSAAHARTMNGVWGKPGNGAPNTSSRRRKHEDDSEIDIPTKRSNIYTATEKYSPIADNESDSGHTIQEDLLTYVSRERNSSGQSVTQHVTAHQKISNTSKKQQQQLAPFATELSDGYEPSFPATIHPVMTSSNNNNNKNYPVKTDVSYKRTSAVNDDVPPAGKIVFSNAIRKKLMLQQQQQQQQSKQ